VELFLIYYPVILVVLFSIPNIFLFILIAVGDKDV